MSKKGYSKGKLDKLARSCERLEMRGIPIESWPKPERMYHALYVTGGGCPSCGIGEGVNLTPEMNTIESPFTAEELEEIYDSEA